MQSTPTNALLAENAEPSLHIRKQILAAKYIAKLLNIRNYPALNLIETLELSCRRKDGYWKSRETPCIVQAYRRFQRYRRSIDKRSLLSCFEIPIKYQIGKIKHHHLSERKSDFEIYEWVDTVKSKWPMHAWIFTDASKDPICGIAGIGIFSSMLKVEHSARLPDGIQICTAEVLAIHEALKLCHFENVGKAIIFTDSQSAIKKICNTDRNIKKD